MKNQKIYVLLVENSKIGTQIPNSEIFCYHDEEVAKAHYNYLIEQTTNFYGKKYKSAKMKFSIKSLEHNTEPKHLWWLISTPQNKFIYTYITLYNKEVL